MMDILNIIGMDWRDRRLISNLYMNQIVTVKIGEEFSEPGVSGRGARQGCCLSPLLFSLYSEMMMIEALDDIEEGVKIGGRLLQDVRFADDQAMVSSREAGLQRLLDRLVETAKTYDMKVNVKKTKVMKVSRQGKGDINIFIDGKRVEQVTSFKYLGCCITEDGTCKTEIRVRISMSKAA